MARRWQRAHEYAACGNCGTAVEEHAPILAVMIGHWNASGHKRYRCPLCADEPVDHAQLADYDRTRQDIPVIGDDRPKSPGLDACLVQTPHGALSGYRVSDPGSRQPLGWIWPAGGGWRWKTPDNLYFGERNSQRRAVEALVTRFAGDGASRPPPELRRFTTQELVAAANRIRTGPCPATRIPDQQSAPPARSVTARLRAQLAQALPDFDARMRQAGPDDDD